MELNNYNDNEDKFSKTLKSLKELPKVNAPDNFEFNLMIKITNGEFNSEAEEKRQSKWLWILTPAALVVTSVILFITLSQNDIETQLNPIQNQGSIYAGKTGDSALKIRPKASVPLKIAQKRNIQTEPSITAQNQPYQVEPAIPTIQEYYNSPLLSRRSFKLDNLLKGKSGNRLNSWSQDQTVGDGLNLPEELLLNEGNSTKSLKEKNAVRDSLKRMLSTNDSLKMKKNIKR